MRDFISSFGSSQGLGPGLKGQGWLVGLAAVAIGVTMLPAPPAAAFVCLSPAGGIQENPAFCVRWTVGVAPIRTFLGPSGGALLNGTTSWDANVLSAAQDWSNASTGFRFDVSTGGVFHDPCGPRGPMHACTDTGPAGDNPIFFSDTICGAGFGDIIAQTTNCFDPRPFNPRMVNSPVFFNANERWNAYDGALRREAIDIRRVILHELGHVLGLLHPDDHGQFRPAVMNRRVSNFDRLEADDFAGVRFLYSDGAPPIGDPPPGAKDGCQVDPAAGQVSVAWLLLGLGFGLLLRLRRSAAALRASAVLRSR